MKLNSPDGKTKMWFEALSWTTNAPYRETQSAISAMQKKASRVLRWNHQHYMHLHRLKTKPIFLFPPSDPGSRIEYE